MNTSQQFTKENNIYWVGSNFTSKLGDLPCKVPKQFTSYVQKLPRSMNDSEILKELVPLPVSTGEILAFLKTADEDGWYIFYVKDLQGALWAVNAYWSAGGGGWHVEARSVEFPSSWLADDQVVSRGPFGTQATLKPSDTLTLPDTLIINGQTYTRV